MDIHRGGRILATPGCCVHAAMYQWHHTLLAAIIAFARLHFELSCSCTQEMVRWAGIWEVGDTLRAVSSRSGFAGGHLWELPFHQRNRANGANFYSLLPNASAASRAGFTVAGTRRRIILPAHSVLAFYRRALCVTLWPTNLPNGTHVHTVGD
jgi:hypothetical protein